MGEHYENMFIQCKKACGICRKFKSKLRFKFLRSFYFFQTLYFIKVNLITNFVFNSCCWWIWKNPKDDLLPREEWAIRHDVYSKNGVSQRQKLLCGCGIPQKTRTTEKVWKTLQFDGTWVQPLQLSIGNKSNGWHAIAKETR